MLCAQCVNCTSSIILEAALTSNQGNGTWPKPTFWANASPCVDHMIKLIQADYNVRPMWYVAT